MKHLIWLYAIVWFLSPIALWAQADQSQQGLEISVLGLRRQKAWSFSDGNPDPSVFLSASMRIRSSQCSDLRFDGLYQRVFKEEDDRSRYGYLRFFEDGTVSQMRPRFLDEDDAVIEPNRDLTNWVFGQMADLTRDPYTTEGCGIRFTESYDSPDTPPKAYEGTIEPNGLKLKWSQGGNSGSDEFKFVSVGREPPGPLQKPMFRAAPGYDMVVLLLKVKTLEAKASLDFSRLHVEDEQGKTYKCAFEDSTICGKGVEGAEKTCGVPFPVPEGIRLSKLRYGETTFELQHLESKTDAPR